MLGGTGLTGTLLVEALTGAGLDVCAASPSCGVDAVDGDGLAEALHGADVVVDVMSPPSFADDDVMEFFTASTRTVLAEEERSGVGHHVVLSIVGAPTVTGSGYMRAKTAQEDLVRAGPVPWTIVRAGQFYEFATGIADASTSQGVVRLPTATVQPVALHDVVEALARIVEQPPAGAALELAGPEAVPLDRFVREVLVARGDPRRVVGEEGATYFGGVLDDTSMTPGHDPSVASALVGTTALEDWLAHGAA